MTNKYMTVLQYSEAAKCTPQNVYKKIKNGSLKAERIGKTWLIIITKKHEINI